MDPIRSGLIDSFPPEVLGLIFKEVHAAQLATTDPDPSGQDDDPNSEEKSDITDSEDIIDVSTMLNAARSPDFFPYAVASVCRYWEEVLSSTPSFWTVVVIFLDSVDGTDLNKAQTYLTWSRDLPIDVFITRKPKGPSQLEDQTQLSNIFESGAVPAFLEAVMPHLQRCRTLHIDVAASSSIPILPRFLPSAAPLLRHLSFDSEVGINVWNPAIGRHIFMGGSLAFENISLDKFVFEFKPRLTTLAIDGRNVQHAFSEGHAWLSQLSDLKTLSISHYFPLSISHSVLPSANKVEPHKCVECRLSLYPLLQTLQSCKKLKELMLESVAFYIDPNTFNHPDEEYDLLHVQSFVMHDMAAPIIQEIFRVVSQDAETIEFLRCPRLNNARLANKSNSALRLIYMGPEFDIVSFLIGWECDTLTIWECPSFSDAVLDAFSVRWSTTPDGRTSFPCCGFLSVFHVNFDSDPPFTISALKKMVENRTLGVDNSNQNWSDTHVGMPLEHLLVTGQPPRLQVDDEAWFRSRLSLTWEQ